MKKKNLFKIIATVIITCVINSVLSTKAIAQSFTLENHIILNGVDDLNDKAVDILPTNDCGSIVLYSTESFTHQTDILVKRYDAMHNELWSYNYPNSGIDNPIKLTSDANKNIYIAASTDSFNTGGLDLLVISLTQFGSFRWAYNENISLNTNDSPSDILVTNNNTLFVCGSVNTGGFVRTISTSNGAYINGFDEIVTIAGNASPMIKMSEKINNEVVVLNNAKFSSTTIPRLYYFNSTTGAFNAFNSYSSCWNCGEYYPTDIYATTNGSVFITGYRVRNSDTSLFVKSSVTSGSDFYSIPYNAFSSSKGKDIFINHNNDLIVCGDFDSDTNSIAVDPAIKILRFNSQNTLVNNASLGSLDGVNQHTVKLLRSSTSTGSLTLLYERQSPGNNQELNLFRLNSNFNPIASLILNADTTSHYFGSSIALDSYDNVIGCGFHEKANTTTDADYYKAVIYNFNDSLINMGLNQIACSYPSSPVYYWYINNIPVDTTTTNILNVTMSGNFSCIFIHNCQLDTAYYYNVILSETEITTKKHYILYPNPSNGIIHLGNLICNENIEIQILNSLGQIQLHQTFTNENAIELHLENYPKGIYFLKYRCGGIYKTEKIIKQ